MERASGYWINCFKRVQDFTHPQKCSLCELLGDLNPCVQCRGEMQPSEPVVAHHYGDSLSYVGSAFRYPGRAGQAVKRMKYERRTGLAEFMSLSVKDAVEREGIEFDLAVPIPIHWFRLVGRGFNQAELVAQALPNRTNVLRRTRATRPQAGLTTSERLKNLEGAFEVISDVTGKSILLIDDVITSGQTARECARVLCQAGASCVGVFAFCGDTY